MKNATAPKTSKSRALTVVPEKPLVEGEYQLMGQQLTAQYRLAVGGMKDVVKLGAMMMMLEEKLNLSNDGHVSGGRGKKGGVSEWLRTYAPDVKRPTAYRFKHIAEAVAEEYKDLLPAKVSFVHLLTTPLEKLPLNLQKKQAALLGFVDGTEKQSWLDRFAPAPEKGGKRTKEKELTPEEQEKLAREDAHALFKGLHGTLWGLQNKTAEQLKWIPTVSQDPAKEIDLTHLETAMIASLQIVQEELVRRGAKVTKVK